MDLSSVLTAIIAALAGVDPIVYICLLVTGGLGYVWFTDRRSFEAQLKALRDEFAAMVAQKDARYDALQASTSAAIAAAQAQVASVVKDHSDANKDTAEMMATVGQTMNQLATTVQQMIEDARNRRG